MKKITLITLLLLLCGCSAMSAWVDAQAACANDPQCMEKTKSYAKIGEAVAGGFGPIASAGVGATITFLSLGILGLKKKKEK